MSMTGKTRNFGGFGASGPIAYKIGEGLTAFGTPHWHLQTYETGDLGEVQSYSDTGTVEVVEDDFAGSTYALRVDSDGSAVVWARNTGWNGATHGASAVSIYWDKIHSGYFLKIVDMPATKEWLNAFYHYDAGLLGGIQVDGSGDLTLVDRTGSTVGVGSISLTEGTTYWVELMYQPIQGQYVRVALLVNGDVALNGVGLFQTTGGESCSEMTISAKTKLNADSWEYRIDDWYWDNVQHWPHRAKLALPISAGTNADLRWGGTYADVDELPPDDVAYRDQEQQAPPNNWGYFSVDSQDFRHTLGLITSTEISALKVISKVKNPNFTNNSTIKVTHWLFANDTEDGEPSQAYWDDYDSSPLELHDDYTYMQHFLTQHFPNGSALTVDAMNSYDFGLYAYNQDYELSGDFLRCDFIGLMVYYRVYPETQKDTLPYFDLGRS